LLEYHTNYLSFLYFLQEVFMSLELELRLEGQEANEETLSDLMDWLADADIEGLTIRRKKLPPIEGNMSAEFDSTTLVMLFLAIPPAMHATGALINAIRTWLDMKKKAVSVNAGLTNAGEELENNASEDLKKIEAQIQAQLAEIKAKRYKGKK
jgi:hypothetical protein